MNIQVPCKYCSSIIEAPLKWAQDNKRLFCAVCCKSMEVNVQVGYDPAKEDSDKTVETKVEDKQESIEELAKESDEEETEWKDQYTQVPYNTDDYDWDLPF